MRVIITAVPGCGKTTIVKYLQKRVKIDFINFGDVMYEISKERYGCKNRDEMRRKIPPEKYKDIQVAVARKIAKKKSVIIDTHSSIKTAKGFYPGNPEKVIRALKPELIIIIEKSPKEIIIRRRADKKRTTRDVETEEEIEEHQMMNRYYAAIYSVLAGCAVAIINLRYKEGKRFDHARDAAQQISELIGGVNV